MPRTRSRRYRGGMDADGDDPMNGPPAAAGAGAGAGAAPLALPPVQLLGGPPLGAADRARIRAQINALPADHPLRAVGAPVNNPGGLLLVGPPPANNARNAAIAANNRRIGQEFAARLGLRGGSRRSQRKTKRKTKRVQRRSTNKRA